MKKKELFLMTAEADAKHLQAKLNEVEADALDDIAKYHKKINELELEMDTAKNKKEVLMQKLDQVKLADDAAWEKSSKEFVETIESLQDKHVFKTKTEEWFKSIQNIVNGLKVDIKGKVM
jgi:chromosome condensin MukBEF ATPase and DNA-binding subunit MukB